ncbi:hypothetical protein KUTeg_020389 [Tegillarca granosa]|uniref:EGF-like domain-containing protein n=1 Tax=Tegillarca granosa TaxID=220873 RepID=A0ABQ9E7W6_TEGGR|nr:hypothetical protein KUTeg_020389 [Tegillarca granosa]
MAGRVTTGKMESLTVAPVNGDTKVKHAKEIHILFDRTSFTCCLYIHVSLENQQLLIRVPVILVRTEQHVIHGQMDSRFHVLVLGGIWEQGVKKAKLMQRATLTPCMSFPCKNGGICKNSFDGKSYECICPNKYSGENCQKGIIMRLYF